MRMKISKRKLVQLKEQVLQLMVIQSKHDDLIRAKISDLSREIWDVLDPPKKGYLRFKTLTGWIQFKKTKKRRLSERV